MMRLKEDCQPVNSKSGKGEPLSKTKQQKLMAAIIPVVTYESLDAIQESREAQQFLESHDCFLLDNF